MVISQIEEINSFGKLRPAFKHAVQDTERNKDCAEVGVRLGEVED